MDRQTLHSNPLEHLAVFTLDPNRGDHSSLLIRRLRTTNAKDSRCNSRKRTKEKAPQAHAFEGEGFVHEVIMDGVMLNEAAELSP